MGCLGVPSEYGQPLMLSTMITLGQVAPEMSRYMAEPVNTFNSLRISYKIGELVW